MEDIAPELLKAVQAAFNLNMANESIAKKKAKIDSGEASYADAEEYAYDVGHALAEAMKECVSSDVLPDGRMYYNIAQKLLQPVLENNYNAMCDVVEKVQAHLNEEAGIGIKPIIPPLNQDRIDGLIKNASDAEHYDDVAKSVSDGTTNFTQNVIDESIAANADFHYQAGMEPKIVRTAAGGDSCDMCLELQGVYSYPVDKSLYMRHKECRCIVEYVPKDGKRQNVHSRQWKTDPELIEARKKVGLEEKRDDEKLINDAINSQMELLKKYGSETNLYINGSFDELNNWDNFKKITEKNGKDILVEMSKNPNEWENIIKMQSEDTFKPLVDKLLSVADDKELKALNTWSASTYSLINRYMRYGIDSGEIAENAAKNIKSVLDKVTTDEVIIVHRGTGTKHMLKILSETGVKTRMC